MVHNRPKTLFTGNGIIERVHLTLNDALRTAEVYGKEMDEKDPWGPFLSSAAYAIRSTFHTTLKATPGQLVFGRDMVLPITCVADWGAIEQQGQKEMAHNNRRKNASRINHDYKVLGSWPLEIVRISDYLQI
jgi:hypothetical protein